MHTLLEREGKKKKVNMRQRFHYKFLVFIFLISALVDDKCAKIGCIIVDSHINDTQLSKLGSLVTPREMCLDSVAPLVFLGFYALGSGLLTGLPSPFSSMLRVLHSKKKKKETQMCRNV